MEKPKKKINYILLITIVISSIFINIILTRAILNSSFYDTFTALPILFSLLILIGILILFKTENRTIGWALVWAGLMNVSLYLFLTFGIAQLYSI